MAKCPECSGYGRKDIYDENDEYERSVDCERCKGSGVVPDDDEDIIREKNDEFWYGKRLWTR